MQLPEFQCSPIGVQCETVIHLNQWMRVAQLRKLIEVRLVHYCTLMLLDIGQTFQSTSLLHIFADKATQTATHEIHIQIWQPTRFSEPRSWNSSSPHYNRMWDQFNLCRLLKTSQQGFPYYLAAPRADLGLYFADLNRHKMIKGLFLYLYTIKV